MISPCGMYCSNCIRYRASHDEVLQSYISGRMKIPASAASCPGCRTMNREARSGISACMVFQCTGEKNIDYCYECSAFPCEILIPCDSILSDEFAYHKIINLSILRDSGADKLISAVSRSKKFYEQIPGCPCRQDTQDLYPEEPLIDISITDQA